MQRGRERRRRLAMLAIVALVFVGWALFDYFSAQQSEVPVKDQTAVKEARENQPDSVIRAAEALGRLAVREAADRDGYSRDKFSSGWAVVDGCDMRNQILKRDLVEVKLGNDSCVVLSGVLALDPYTDKTINFTRGTTTSRAVQIDHVVALSDAWAKGAQSLSAEQRASFANDGLNLLAVDGPANMQKGGSDAHDWLPGSKYRCRYVARQIAVKLKYELWVTRAEHGAIKRTLATCPDQLLPIESQ